jgi:hypothetical protein
VVPYDERRQDKFVPRKSTIAEPYTPPYLAVLDANAAKAKLQANGNPKDPKTQRMSLIEEQADTYWWQRPVNPVNWQR